MDGVRFWLLVGFEMVDLFPAAERDHVLGAKPEALVAFRDRLRTTPREVSGAERLAFVAREVPGILTRLEQVRQHIVPILPSAAGQHVTWKALVADALFNLRHEQESLLEERHKDPDSLRLTDGMAFVGHSLALLPPAVREQITGDCWPDLWSLTRRCDAMNMALIPQQMHRIIKRLPGMITACETIQLPTQPPASHVNPAPPPPPLTQPLERFHGDSPLARRVEAARDRIIAMIARQGGWNVMVHGRFVTEQNPTELEIAFEPSRLIGGVQLDAICVDIDSLIDAPTEVTPIESLRGPRWSTIQPQLRLL